MEWGVHNVGVGKRMQCAHVRHTDETHAFLKTTYFFFFFCVCVCVSNQSWLHHRCVICASNRTNPPATSSPSLETPENHRYGITVMSDMSHTSSTCYSESRTLASADRKRGQRKRATSKNVQNRQKVSKIFSTLFDEKKSKIVKKCQSIFDTFRKFSSGTSFPAPLGGSDGCEYDHIFLCTNHTTS